MTEIIVTIAIVVRVGIIRETDVVHDTIHLGKVKCHNGVEVVAAAVVILIAGIVIWVMAAAVPVVVVVAAGIVIGCKIVEVVDLMIEVTVAPQVEDTVEISEVVAAAAAAAMTAIAEMTDVVEEVAVIVTGIFGMATATAVEAISAPATIAGCHKEKRMTKKIHQQNIYQ